MPKGYKHTEETKQKMRLARLGKEPWNKNKKGTYMLGACAEETKKKISIALMGKKTNRIPKSAFKKGQTPWNKGQKNVFSEETGMNWKGDEAGYFARHIWINKKLGKAYKCSINSNHISTLYVWANKSGEYKRDLSDWWMLCQRCNKNDGVSVPDKFKDYRRRNQL